jgi:hypothetical protein
MNDVLKTAIPALIGLVGTPTGLFIGYRQSSVADITQGKAAIIGRVRMDWALFDPSNGAESSPECLRAVSCWTETPPLSLGPIQSCAIVDRRALGRRVLCRLQDLN